VRWELSLMGAVIFHTAAMGAVMAVSRASVAPASLPFISAAAVKEAINQFLDACWLRADWRREVSAEWAR